MNSLRKSILLATIAGMRSMMSPALVAYNLTGEEKKKLQGSAIGALDRPGTRRALGLMTAGELLGDKLPFAPSRLALFPIVGRALSGAACGGLMYLLDGKRTKDGLVLGAVTAVTSATLFFSLRKLLTATRFLGEPSAGLLEDIVAFYLAEKYIKEAVSNN